MGEHMKNIMVIKNKSIKWAWNGYICFLHSEKYNNNMNTYLLSHLKHSLFLSSAYPPPVTPNPFKLYMDNHIIEVT